MKESRLNQLFAAARQESPPPPEAGFEKLVLAAVRHEPAVIVASEISWRDQISAWAPRLALACAGLILLSVGVEFALDALGVPSLTEGVAQISNDWLLTLNSI